MNTWQNRVLMFLVLALALGGHAACLQGKPNTPIGLLGFHTSAAIVDLILLRCAPLFLQDRLLEDTENLCWLSIAVNFMGWMLYMAYAPPFFYNTAQWILCAIQWGRLFIVDDDNAADTMGRSPISRPIGNWPQLDFRKKAQ